MVAIVIPTFNEASNVEQLVARIRSAMAGTQYEVLFVDDSTDQTPDVLGRIAAQDPRVRYIHREGQRGLASAVVAGFEQARGDVLVVMDADLQHPPEMIPTLLSGMAQTGADIVVPCRYMEGGSTAGFSSLRKAMSLVAKWLAQALLSCARRTRDPLSGFFVLKRSVIEGANLQPIGWKVLLEVLARGNYRLVLDVPYAFRARNSGISKMTLRQQWDFLLHLTSLLLPGVGWRRIVRFGLVGAGGVVVNMGLLWFLVQKAGLPPAPGALCSANLAMVHNFLWHDAVTWGDRRARPQWWQRFWRFWVTSWVGIVLNVLTLQLLVALFGVHYLLANGVGIAAAATWDFIVNHTWTWAAHYREAPGASVRRRETVGERYL